MYRHLWLTRSMAFWALCLSILSPALAQAIVLPDDMAHASQHVQSGWETFFSRHVSATQETVWWDDASGEALGSVQRSRWTQPLRAHFTFYDNEGTLRAEGTQPWGLGVVVPGMANLQLLDNEHNPLGLIQGNFMAMGGGRFKIFNKHETHVADAWVDASGDSVIFSHPRGPLAQFAGLTRRPHGHRDVSRWHLIVQDPDIIARDAWPVIAAFFAKKLGAGASPAAREQTLPADERPELRGSPQPSEMPLH